jgi:transposase InsO family protein
VLHVSPGAYNQWRSPLSNLSVRQQRHANLQDKIRTIHTQSNGTYGSPRIAAQLRRDGTPVNEKTVAKIMQENDIRAKTKKKFKVTTTSTKIKNAAPNLVKQNFSSSRPNQLWTRDLTYIWTREGWLYFAIILDVFARRIVGYAMGVRLSASLVTAALEQALTHRQPPATLVLHSDRGSQYASDELRLMILAHRLVQSMSGTGNCYDNAITETFFHTLKTEMVFWKRFETRDEARRKIFDYIERWYNRQRLHSSLGYMTPLECEQQFHHQQLTITTQLHVPFSRGRSESGEHKMNGVQKMSNILWSRTLLRPIKMSEQKELMLTDTQLKSKVGALSDKFWFGGIANPITAFEQMSYLILLTRLEDMGNARVARQHARDTEGLQGMPRVVLEQVVQSRRESRRAGPRRPHLRPGRNFTKVKSRLLLRSKKGDRGMSLRCGCSVQHDPVVSEYWPCLRHVPTLCIFCRDTTPSCHQMLKKGKK